MKQLMILTTVLAFSVIGCAATPQKPNQEQDPAITALEQSAQEVEAALRQLVLLQTDQKQGGLRAVLPKDGPLGTKIVMKWNGPIEPAIKRVSRAIKYNHLTLGTAPAAPIIVKVDVIKEKAYYVLDSIAWQAANKAQILVDPLKKQITLAYLPTFGASSTQAPSIPTAPESKQ